MAQISGAYAGPLMAVDFGGEFIKVSVVKPGRTPISIVPNEMSKRRTSAQVCLAKRTTTHYSQYRHAVFCPDCVVQSGAKVPTDSLGWVAALHAHSVKSA